MLNSKWILGFAALALALPQDESDQGPPAQRVESDYFRVQRALENWKGLHGPDWQVVFNKETGAARFLYGGSAEPSMAPVSDQSFFQLADEAVRNTEAIHGIDAATLVPDAVIFLPLGMTGSSDKMTVRYQQMVGGVEVIEGSVNVLFDMQGRLLSLDSKAFPEIADFDVTPRYDADTALEMARDAFRADTGLPTTHSTAPELLIDRPIEDKLQAPSLVWEVTTQFQAPDTEPEGYTYRFDAHDGSLVNRSNAIHYLDVSGTVRSMATPGTLPDKAGNGETSQVMPYLTVTSSQGNATTDANGNFTIAGASPPLSVTVSYSGTYTDVDNSNGSDYSLTTTLNSSSGNTILMNPSSSAQVTSQANALNWIGMMRDWTRAVNPSDSTSDFNGTANVNISSSCNAFFDGSSTNYYLPGGGCVNTSYSSVVLHEMGHWLNVRYSSGNGPDGFGEGNADNFSTYILDDPIVGKDFCGTGCHIRDANNLRQYCGDGNGGCHGGVHANGEVLMGACWKVRSRLKTAHGTGAGGAIADTLFNSWMNAYDQTTIDSIIEIQWLTLDDDNGNINDGTPNYAHIDGGFTDQGFPGFQLNFVTFSNVTELGNTEDEVGPYTVTADISALLNPPIDSADLYYSVDDGPFTQLPMLNVGGDTYSADIPGQVSPAKVEYYLSATDDNANTNTFPDAAPSQVIKFVVGIETVHYLEDFESGTNGWTHVSNNGAQDDWQLSSQVGADGSFGKSGDPNNAVSGTNIWGNDLGPSGWNGAYQNGVNNSLLSPSIDLTGVSGAILQLKRWLTIEDGTFDQAILRVNGTTVFTNSTAADTIDTNWVDMEFDISFVDGNPNVQLEFNLVTDGGVVFGGWNIDDIRIVCIDPANSIPPVAEFNGTPTSGTAPLLVSFSDLSTGDVNGWSWTFGDGGTSTGQAPSHTYNNPGTYAVSLTATGPAGSDTETKNGYILVNPGPPTADFSATPTSGNAPLDVEFTDLSVGGVTSWAWTFGDGGTSTQQTPTHTYNAAGTYSVTLSATGPGGSDGETKNGYIVVVPPAPVAEFVGSPTSGVAPLDVTFTDQTTGSVTSWTWDFGDGMTSSSQNPSHTYASAGSYTVSLSSSGPGGSDSETKSDYIVVVPPAPVADFLATPTSGTAPLDVFFLDLSTGDVDDWDWDFGDGTTSSLVNPTHTYAAPGTYTVSLTASGAGGSDTETKVDYIVVIGVPPAAEFLGAPQVGTAPLTVNFLDLSTGDVTSWAWDFGDGGTSTLEHPSHLFTDPGTYTVSLTATGSGGSDTETKVDYIVAQIPASAVVRNGNDVNDLCLVNVSLPRVGTDWIANVDATSHPGAGLTFILGYDMPIAPLSTPFGELLIANEVLGGTNAFVSQAPSGGGIANHVNSIPNDPTLAGIEIFTQGIILGGGPELCNAIDLVIGF